MRYSLAFAASVSVLARVYASPVEAVDVVSQAPPALATASLTAGTEPKSSLVHAAANANAVSPVPATAPGQYDDLFLCYGQNCRGGCQVVQLAQLKALTCYTSPLVSLAFASVQWPVTGSPAYKVPSDLLHPTR
jgi:hypothetical protein